MKTASKTKAAPGRNLPEIPLATAEKLLRDIARRNGEAIRKRRSVTLKRHLGDGYCVIDPMRNILLSGAQAHDGCDLSLSDLAEWYKDSEGNTPWQQIVIQSVIAGKVSEAETS